MQSGAAKFHLAATRAIVASNWSRPKRPLYNLTQAALLKLVYATALSIHAAAMLRSGHHFLVPAFAPVDDTLSVLDELPRSPLDFPAFKGWLHGSNCANCGSSISSIFRS